MGSISKQDEFDTIAEYIRDKAKDNFYGRIIVSMQNGKVDTIKVEQSHVLIDIEEYLDSIDN